MTAPAYSPQPRIAPGETDVPRPLTARRGTQDRAFRGLARGSGGLVLGMMALVGGSWCCAAGRRCASTASGS
jgi:hypothetical protein